MQRIGTDDAGFSVTLDPNVVHVVGWGFWDRDVASSFDRFVIEACLHAPVGADVLLDMSRLRPMRDEGQQSFANALRAIKRSRIARVLVKTESDLTKLQLLRIAREVLPKERVHFI